MDNVWLKVAAVAVVVVAALIGLAAFTSGDDSPPAPRPEPRTDDGPKTVYDQWEEDEKKMEAKPGAADLQTNDGTNTTAQQNTEPAEDANTAVAQQSAPRTPDVPPEPEGQPQFRQLESAQKYDAERLWNWIKQKRKMSRLPMLGAKEMTDKCRELMSRYPGTEYDYKCRRVLRDLPVRYRKMHDITEEEMDLSKFYNGGNQ